jgi:hypothetical protein
VAFFCSGEALPVELADEFGGVGITVAAVALWLGRVIPKSWLIKSLCSTEKFGLAFGVIPMVESFGYGQTIGMRRSGESKL